MTTALNTKMTPGPLNLMTDVAGLWVGHAQDEALKSGVTVLTGERPFTASVHVMGGAPGTRETDLLSPDKSVAEVDALVLSGGSAFGLEAASGVTEALRAAGRGYRVGDICVPIVPGAIIFDLLNGGDKAWAVNPYADLGRRAYQAAVATKDAGAFELGSVGAGTGATTAVCKGGLGSASLVLEEQAVRVAALVVANPLGSVITENGYFWAAPDEIGDEFGGLGPDPNPGHATHRPRLKTDLGEGGNTTIAIVATDACLSKSEVHRMAIAAHDGMARAIVPSHTPMDGDLVFALATGGAGAKKALDLDALLAIGHGAATCLSRAIARAIYEARPQDRDLLACFRDRL